jgi:hypothetical protein
VIPCSVACVFKRVLFALVAFVAVAAACGGGSSNSVFPEGALPLWANRDLAVGEERLLVGVVAEDGARFASPETPVTLEVAPADEPSAVQSRQAGFTWAVPNVAGFYRAVFLFDRPGIWELTVRAEGGEALDAVLIQVRGDSCRLPESADFCAPRVGEVAPSVDTPTARDVSFAELTSDSDPDARLYELSLHELLTNGRTGVIVFATPAFCQTATCGPVLENIKPIISDHPDVDFLHIEVYTGLLDEAFIPDFDHLAPAMLEWTLFTEPWVFVVDGDGVIVARFEGSIDQEELTPHL